MRTLGKKFLISVRLLLEGTIANFRRAQPGYTSAGILVGFGTVIIFLSLTTSSR